MQRELKIFVEDIITAIDKIEKYSTGMTKEILMKMTI